MIARNTVIAFFMGYLTVSLCSTSNFQFLEEEQEFERYHALY